jgi:outer membrane protein assembly factor BamE (lipoprotein component of BamABCDE complex)
MIRLLITAFLLITLTACVNAHRIRVDQGVLIEPETLKYLQSGLTQEQVRKLIGPPANVSSFTPNRWEYIFHSSDVNFQTDKIKMLLIEFDTKGYVTTWSQS